MSTPTPPQIVTIKIANNRIVADPPTVTVVEAQVYFEFRLEIPGMKFAGTSGIQIPTTFTPSFLGPWPGSTDTRLSLLDVCNIAGNVFYRVNVINSAGIGQQLIFADPPKIVNQLPQ